MTLYARDGERLVYFPATRPANEARQGDTVLARYPLDRQRKRLFNSCKLNLLIIRRRYRMGETLSLTQHHGELASCLRQVGRRFGPDLDLFTIWGDGKAGLHHDLVSSAAGLGTHRHLQPAHDAYAVKLAIVPAQASPDIILLQL